MSRINIIRDSGSSKISTNQAPSSDGTFLSLCILTVFFILLEISYFIQCNGTYFSDYTFVSDHLVIPISILPGIIYFLLAQLFVHAIYCISIWIVLISIGQLIQIPSNKKLKYAISLWLLATLTVLAANQYYYPNSKLVEITSIFLFKPMITEVVYFLLMGVTSIVIFVALLGLIKCIVQRKVIPYFFLIIFTCISTIVALKHDKAPQVTSASAEFPNIFLVGIDSLRPDFLGYFGGHQTTPFIDTLLTQAIVFTQSITPLARTFPAWTSVLTGQYPRLTKARSDLADQTYLKLANTLPAILRRHGYETLYATDETRFSNLDKNFGFDKIVAPPMGLNDFLIGTFNDFPLSNLLINTPVGKWLFPHSYGNRPVDFVYDPNSFLNLLQSAIKQRPNKPLFLAVHFCLPHSPYLWASLSAGHLSIQERYVKSIERVDQQLRDFMTILQQDGLLNHAIVVLLSDHGEALELPGDRITEAKLYISSHHPTSAIPKFYPPSLDDEAINQSAGHGTDVLGLSQYHTVLAFKLFGIEPHHHSLNNERVSLLDIKPTILDLLHLPNSETSGVSLASLIKGDARVLPARHFFLESDFSPAAIRTIYPQIRAALLEGIDIYQVNPSTTRLTIKEDMMVKIIKSKQYADMYKDWILALYPQNSYTQMPILVNLKTREWTNNLQTPFAQQAPVQLMLNELKLFYGDEIKSCASSSCSQIAY